MQAELSFRDATPEFEVEGVKVRTVRLPHPGGCLGYRLEVDGSVFVFATDSELDLGVLNKEEVRADQHAPRRYEPALLEFFRARTRMDVNWDELRGWPIADIVTGRVGFDDDCGRTGNPAGVCGTRGNGVDGSFGVAGF